MPPKASSRASSGSPEAANPSRTPSRTGLRSQSNTPAPDASVNTADNTQREHALPQLPNSNSNSYGGPSRAGIARTTDIVTGAADVSQAFGAALTSALQRAGDNTAATPGPRRSNRNVSRTPSAHGNNSDAESVASGRSTRTTASGRVTRAQTAAAAAMPSIAENGNSSSSSSPSDVQNSTNNTTRLDTSYAGAFNTPSRIGTPPAQASPADGIFQSAIRRHGTGSTSTNLAAAQGTGFATQHGTVQDPNQGYNFLATVRGSLPERLNAQFLLKILSAILVFVAFLGAVSLLMVPTDNIIRYKPGAMLADGAIHYIKAPFQSFACRATGGLCSGSSSSQQSLQAFQDPDHSYVLKHRVESLETQMAMVIKRLDLHQLTLAQIDPLLPARVIIHKNGEGDYRIPDEFWKAIQARMQLNNEAAWQEFINKNEQRVWDYFDTTPALKHDKDYIAWKAEHHSASREEFVAMLNENHAALQDDIRKHATAYDARLESLERKITDTLADSVEMAIKALTGLQLSTLALVNLVKNTEMHLRNVNFFAPSLGAQVNPYHSSPTAQAFNRNLPHRSFFQAFKGYVPHPHIMALEPWSEPKDCWCAAPPESPQPREEDVDRNDPETWPANREPTTGPRVTPQLQLEILLRHTIFPKAVTVEHFPKAGTLDSSAMPREMELWASVPDPVKRAKLIEAASTALDERQEQLPSPRPYASLDLDQSMVKLAKFTYDRDSTNHVQTFPVDVSALKVGAGISRVVLRATSNYGGDVTCLYRARLHGGEVETK